MGVHGPQCQLLYVLSDRHLVGEHPFLLHEGEDEGGWETWTPSGEQSQAPFAEGGIRI